jgi:hypothetical protein
VSDEQFAFRLNQLRLNVFEVDALERLLDVQLPLRAFVIYTIPIEYAISRVAVLLDFDQQIACTYRVKSSSRQKCGVTRSDRNFVNVISRCSFAQRLFESIARTAFTKPVCSAPIGGGDVQNSVSARRQFPVNCPGGCTSGKLSCISFSSSGAWSVGSIRKLLRCSVHKSCNVCLSTDHSPRRSALPADRRFPMILRCVSQQQFLAELRLERRPPHAFHEKGFEGEGSEMELILRNVQR